MKTSAQQYAQALFEVVVDKPKKEIESGLKNFIVLLNDNNDLNKIDEIIESFQAIWSRENKELLAELTTARELGKASRDEVVNYLKKITKTEKIDLKEKTDKEILGGFILKYNSKVIDGSLKTNLKDLKEKISG